MKTWNNKYSIPDNKLARTPVYNPNITHNVLEIIDSVSANVGKKSVFLVLQTRNIIGILLIIPINVAITPVCLRISFFVDDMYFSGRHVFFFFQLHVGQGWRPAAACAILRIAWVRSNL